MEPEKANEVIRRVTQWAEQQADISGVMLVGSYAHGTARPGSDIDICLFTSNVEAFLQNRDWLKIFGRPERVECEDWGAIKTLRAFYSGQCEVEFNFAQLTWASVNPIDPGTYRVVSDGAQVLYDPSGALNRLLKAVSPSGSD